MSPYCFVDQERMKREFDEEMNKKKAKEEAVGFAFILNFLKTNKPASII